MPIIVGGCNYNDCLLLILLSNELEAEIRLTVDELMREELKNLKLVCCTPSEYCVSLSAIPYHNKYNAFTYGVYM